MIDLEKYREMALKQEADAQKTLKEAIEARIKEIMSLYSTLNETTDYEKRREIYERIAREQKTLSTDESNLEISKGAWKIIEGWTDGTLQKKYNERHKDMEVCSEVMNGCEDLLTREAKIYAYYVTSNLEPTEFKHGAIYCPRRECQKNTGIEITEDENGNVNLSELETTMEQLLLRHDRTVKRDEVQELAQGQRGVLIETLRKIIDLQDGVTNSKEGVTNPQEEDTEHAEK